MSSLDGVRSKAVDISNTCLSKLFGGYKTPPQVVGKTKGEFKIK